MADYIDREAAIDALRDAYGDSYRAEDYIRAIPSADVKPVVRGKWKRGAFTDVAPKGIEFFYCSECGIRYPHIEFPGNFCPNCGADMREQEAKQEPAPATYDLLHEEGGWNLQ